LGIFRFNVYGIGRNIDVLSHRAHLKGDVKPKLVIYLERNTRVGIGLESGSGYRDFVRARLQGKEMVAAIGGRGGLLASIGLRIYDSDPSACARS
jgi:hypothetical protein